VDRNIASGTVPLGQHALAPVSGTPGLFVNPDPVLGKAPTVIPPWFLNQLAEEIRNAVIRGGLTPSKADWSQLGVAMVAIAQSVSGGAGPYVRQGAGIGQVGSLVNVGRAAIDANKLRATIDGSNDFGNFAFEGWTGEHFVPLSNGFGPGRPTPSTTRSSCRPASDSSASPWWAAAAAAARE